MTEIQWRKSSYSQGNGNCVQVGWTKSSFSNGSSACVEVRGDDDAIYLRESDDPDMIVTTSRAKWEAFLAGAKAGEFDL